MSSGASKIPNGEYVLLAEDDKDDYMIFSDAFHEVNLNLELFHVNNGIELMTFLNQKTLALPQMIFLDLNMPLKNGFECLQELKASERLKNVPVIIYTTSNSPVDIEKSLKGKAHLYITKPRSFNQLKKVMQKVLVSDFVSNLTLAPNEKKFLVFSEQ